MEASLWELASSVSWGLSIVRRELPLREEAAETWPSLLALERKRPAAAASTMRRSSSVPGYREGRLAPFSEGVKLGVPLLAGVLGDFWTLIWAAAAAASPEAEPGPLSVKSPPPSLPLEPWERSEV